MDDDFGPDGTPSLACAPSHGFGYCSCGDPRTPASTSAVSSTPTTRRLFTRLLGAAGGLALTPVWARDGVDVGKESWATKLVSAEQVEAAGQTQYATMMKEAQQKRVLAPPNDPQVQRLRFIAQRIIPLTGTWNRRAEQWKWEVNVLATAEINAFCMPGGKIAFYDGILRKLQLTDDEVAMVMGHEIAHALREHARERMGKSAATNIGADLVSSLFGLGDLGRTVVGVGGQLLKLRFSREDESEADLVGMELAARAGYDPAAGITLWEKMAQASKGAPPQFISTHPSGPTRIDDIRRSLPKVQGLYQRAEKPPQRFAPPPAAAQKK
ncbi:Peptidase family M48 [Roseateles sp. YR242]|uniref:M48 family metallopeptidase n=1 Tax=Roseateles sp. YR242 TaxID=1855305 RepID=UPI0008BF8AEA|nr:M48 family metallopeptidase [Roseateles sp. YR242]SEL26687.1 Peptidase family M48 [Roseateles sp. YR242]